MVYAPVELRIQRAMYRDGASEEQVRARIAAQMDDEEKRRRADFTVVNDGVQLLIPQLNRIVEQLKTENSYYKFGSFIGELYFCFLKP